jgi:hypothetical protein
VGNPTKNRFAYVQISLPEVNEPWRAIILCVVMKDNSVPLVIGSSDQAAYAITLVPSMHRMIIGDITDSPTHSLDLLNHHEWNYKQ